MNTRKKDLHHKAFLTPERYAREQMKRMEPPRGQILIASCRSGTYLARRVIVRYRELLAECGAEDGLLSLMDIDYQFANGETCVRLDRHVGGYDVFLFQNSIRQTREFESLPFLSIKCLSDTLSRTLNRIHYGQSVSEVFDQP